MKKYYVVLVRYLQKEDYISIHDFNSAVENNWITEEGDRVWIVPPEAEKSITFVWGFDDLDEAINFYNCLNNNEIGLKCSEV